MSRHLAFLQIITLEHYAQVLTNGMYKATLHRVLNTARGTPRVSAPFFYEPCFEAVLAPAPQLCRWGSACNAHVKCTTSSNQAELFEC